MISLERDRERAVRDTHLSFAVEASAGTGKTRTLIDRILHLVLEDQRGVSPLPLSRIAAITFTEKAAGEMKLRLRDEFEKRARAPGAAAERARQALRDLDIAAISTIHAFAVSLLKERPIEAGLDPRFSALDEIQSELLFREVFEAWLGRAVRERRGPLERALRAGLALDGITELARTLRSHAGQIRDWRPAAPLSEDEIKQRIQCCIKEGASYLSQVTDAQDRLAVNLRQALEWLNTLPQPGAGPQKSGGFGSRKNWIGGERTVALVRSFIEELVSFSDTLSSIEPQRVFHAVVLWLADDFLPQWELRKKQDALLDFDDQLLAARDLLKFNPAVRRYFQERYATLLVDEFQDTDPVQLEIVLLLTSNDWQETHSKRLEPAPGRLFLVGDPKQSIYRFRGADIETYLEAVPQERSQTGSAERLELVTNFRSVPSILSFVDLVFEKLMVKEEGGRYQPNYLPFDGKGWRKEEPNPPSVSLLVDEEDGSGRSYSARKVVESEAARIVQLIQSVRGSEDWKVEERGVSKDITAGSWRVPGYGDIAVLLPVLTHVDILEDALKDEGIPYVLEGGKFYYARSEVSSGIAVLRSVANPNDEVALYGALRSIFFGLSDEDLLRARIEGLPLDYRLGVPNTSALHRPFSILQDLHKHRYDRPASETFEILLRETGAREVLAAHRGGFQSLANLGKLTRTLRARQGNMSFPEAVDFLTSTDEEEFEESESRITEERSNAVRILTIHRAKGLDFPIVFLCGLGRKRYGKQPLFLSGSRDTKTYAVAVGKKRSGFRTANWDELLERERQRQDAELIRLLYVGMTRARDHLVISALHKWKRKKDGAEQPDLAETRLQPVYETLRQMLSDRPDLVRRLEIKAQVPKAAGEQAVDLSPRADLRAILERERGQLDRLLNGTPSSRNLHAPAEHGAEVFEENSPPENRPEGAARDRAIRMGIAFHEAMELAGFGDESRIPEWAAQAGRRHSLDDTGIRLVQEMITRCFNSELIGRARASVAGNRRLLRELAYVRPLSSSGAIEEGKIDLIFEEDGGWVIVDYKTDRLPQGVPDSAVFFRERYSGQIREYAGAVRDLGLNVKAAYLLLARTGEEIEIPF